MTFNSFLKKFIDDDTPFGDFARDWASDKTKEAKKIKTESDLMGYLVGSGACHEAVQAAKKLWASYSSLK